MHPFHRVLGAILAVVVLGCSPAIATAQEIDVEPWDRLFRSMASPAPGVPASGTREDLLDPLVRNGLVSLSVLGRSADRRPIQAYFVGEGPAPIMLWASGGGTQQRLLVDLVRTLAVRTDDPHVAHLRSVFNFVIVPELNPDGAAYRERTNIQGIEPLRDGRDRVSTEARALLRLAGSASHHLSIGVTDTGTSGFPVSEGIALWTPTSRPAERDSTALVAAARAEQFGGLLALPLARSTAAGVYRHRSAPDARFLPERLTVRGAGVIVVGVAEPASADGEIALRRTLFSAILSALQSSTTLGADSAPTGFAALPTAAIHEHHLEADILLRRMEVRIPGVAPFVSDVAIRASGDGEPKIVAMGDLDQSVSARDTIGGRGLGVVFHGDALQRAEHSPRIVLGLPVRYDVVRRTLLQHATIYRSTDQGLEPTSDFRFPRRARWFVSLMPPGPVLSTGTPSMDLALAIDEVGWNSRIRGTNLDGPVVSRSPLDFQIGAGRTFAGSLAVEVVGGVGEAATVRGARDISRQILVDHSTAFIGSLLSYELRNLRFAAGPAAFRSTWGWKSAAGGQSVRGSSSGNGHMLEAGLLLPAGARLGWELRVQQRDFGTSEVGGYEDIPAFEIRQNSVNARIGAVLRR